MLQRNTRTLVGIDHELNSDSSVPDFIGYIRDRCGNTSVLGPRETLEAQTSALAGTNASQGVRRKKSRNDPQLSYGHDGGQFLSFTDHRADPEVGHLAQSSVYRRANAASSDFSLQAFDLCGRHGFLTFDLDELGLEFLNACLLFALLG